MASAEGQATAQNFMRERGRCRPRLDRGTGLLFPAVVGHPRMVSRVVEALAGGEFVFDGLDQGFAEGGRGLEAG